MVLAISLPNGSETRSHVSNQNNNMALRAPKTFKVMFHVLYSLFRKLRASINIYVRINEDSSK